MVHVGTLTVLCVTSAFYAYFNVSTIRDNMQQAGYSALGVSVEAS